MYAGLELSVQMYRLPGPRSACM